MLADYLLPGCVLALKLLFKIFIDQKAKWLDGFRAVLAFPVDITFLSFSYGAATLAHVTPQLNHQIEVKTVGALTLGVVVCALLTTKLSRDSDSALDDRRYPMMISLTFFSYLVAAFVLYWSLHCENMV
jgi:hypothetical protein